MNRLLPVLSSGALVLACAAHSPKSKPEAPPAEAPRPPLEALAERYVRLVLAVGEHDGNYVDAYYGPGEWREDARVASWPLDRIRSEAKATLSDLEKADVGTDPELGFRRSFLTRQLESLVAWVEHLEGKRRSFDEESKAIYDAVSPPRTLESFQPTLDALDRALPGDGPLHERYEAFRSRFVVPKEKLDAVFKAAIEACRERTAARVELPKHESFTVEYVTDKPWSGYNWFKGDAHSLIQVNVSLPIQIDRAIDLACHEGYPGHHVFNLLLEQELVGERGWVEFSVYPLYSPQSLIAEGSANYGVELAFPEEERVRFERETLFPLAGLDPAGADEYYRVLALAKALDYAGNTIARKRIDEGLDEKAAAELFVRYALMSPARAAQRVKFVDTYRSYVINYNLGEDIVRAWVEAKGGETTEGRWKAFAELLAWPKLPSKLVEESAPRAANE